MFSTPIQLQFEAFTALKCNSELVEALHAKELALLSGTYGCKNPECGTGVALYANLGSWRCRCHTGYAQNGLWTCCNRQNIGFNNGCTQCDHWATGSPPIHLVHILPGDVMLYFIQIHQIKFNVDSIIKIEGTGNDPTVYRVHIARCKAMVEKSK